MSQTREIRSLHVTDFNRGYLNLLRQLTEVGEISVEQFSSRWKQIESNPNHYVIVILHNQKIVATGTLFIELKFIHECGKVGHIEEIVVDKYFRKQGLGQQIITHLNTISIQAGCYKTILNCAPDNIGFYQKCGFSPKEQMLVQYY